MVNNSRPPTVATLRLIVTSMIVGSCVIGGAIIFSADRIGGKMIADPLICYVLAGVAVACLIVQGLVIPKAFRPRKATATNETQQLQAYGAETLARVSLLEAAAILQYLCYLFSRNEVTLAAGALLVAAMFFLRPTDESFRRWCERV